MCNKLKFWKSKKKRLQKMKAEQIRQYELEHALKDKSMVSQSGSTVIKKVDSLSSVGGVPLTQFLDIRYKLVKTEQFDNYMKALGINLMSRKIGLKIVPTLLHLNYEYTTRQFTLTTSSTFLNCQVKFKLDQPFHCTTPDGRKCTVTFEFKPPNYLHEKQQGEKLVTVVREFTLDLVHMFLTINNVTCKMTYLNEKKFSTMGKLIHATSPVGTILNEEVTQKK